MSCSISLALSIIMSCSVSLVLSINIFLLYVNIVVVSTDLHTQSIGNITPDGRYNNLLSLWAAVPSLVQLPAECSRIMSLCKQRCGKSFFKTTRIEISSGIFLIEYAIPDRLPQFNGHNQLPLSRLTLLGNDSKS